MTGYQFTPEIYEKCFTFRCEIVPFEVSRLDVRKFQFGSMYVFVTRTNNNGMNRQKESNRNRIVVKQNSVSDSFATPC